MKILITGGTGFIGRNVLPTLSETNEVLSPTRYDLDLFSSEDVKQYVSNNNVDAILHFANPNPAKNAQDSDDRMFEDSMRMFESVFACRDYCQNVFYLGSGAEFDKRFEIRNVRESEFGERIPKDPYGYAKYLQAERAHTTSNVINFRLFGCFGPYDHWTKFITHCIRCVLQNQSVTIRQDCFFDYIHVDDLANILLQAISQPPKYNDYNIASGKRMLLSNIATIVLNEMESDAELTILSGGLNNEYTANPARINEEYNFSESCMSIHEGIRRQIVFERSVFPENGYKLL